MKKDQEDAIDILLEYDKTGVHVEDVCRRKKSSPLSKEIVYGVMRKQLYFDALIKKITEKKPSSKKVRRILHVGMYQLLFLQGTPDYAIVNTLVSIAKKLSIPLSRFVNAYLRNVEEKIKNVTISLQEKASVSSSIFDVMKRHYSSIELDNILETLMKRPVFMYRSQDKSIEDVPLHEVNNWKYYPLKNDCTLPSDAFIQNVTPHLLLEYGVECSNPKEEYCILDICAAPGGKTALLHDFFPNADITACDVSEKRCEGLRDMCQSLGDNVTVVCRDATLPFDAKYSLILCDVPCSNTGVMHKKPEARYSYNDEKQAQLHDITKKLLASADSMIEDGGYIWYTTCSILPTENENVSRHLESMGYVIKGMKAIHPQSDGTDGGFIIVAEKVT